MPDDALLNGKQAADFIGCAEDTLPVWRSTGRHNLPFVKVGRLVRYRRSDLEKWLDDRTHPTGNTSFPATPAPAKAATPATPAPRKAKAGTQTTTKPGNVVKGQHRIGGAA